MVWTERISSKALETAEYLAKGFHAIPGHSENPIKTLPSMHRLLNVVGMVGGFASAQYLSNIIFACKINGSDCKEVTRDEVPPPLRFLHGIAAYNPFSDSTHDQMMKVVHQMIPAVGGAVGAIKGSEIFFTKQNGREISQFRDLLKKDAKTLTPLEADSLRTFAQSKVLRIFAGATAWMSAASGLTFLYGMTLNPAFNLGNGGKFFAGFKELTGLKGLSKFSNTTGDLPFGPAKSLDELGKYTQTMLKDAQNPAIGDKAMETYSKRLVSNVVEPLIKNMKPEEKEHLAAEIKGQISGLVESYKTQGKTANQVADDIKKVVKAQLNSTEVREMGDGMVLGQNGWVGAIAEKAGRWMGFGKLFDSIDGKLMDATPARA